MAKISDFWTFYTVNRGFLCYLFLHLYRPGTFSGGSYCPWRDFKTLRQAIRMYDLTNPYTLADMNPSDWLYSSTACLFKAVAKIPRVNHSFQVAFWRFLSLSPALRKASRGHIQEKCPTPWLSTTIYSGVNTNANYNRLEINNIEMQ